MSKASDNRADDAGTLGKVGDKVSHAVVSVRDAASEAAHSVAPGIDANPLVALLGGLAIGAIAGALVPRSDKERELLAPVGSRVGEAARAAFDAAKTAGGDALGDAGLNQDNVRQQVAKVFEQVFQAAGSAGKAAFSAARDASAK
jgi:hypothetical protein